MKKEYKTPYLIIEPFQLDTAIANCSGETGGIALGYNDDACLYAFGQEYSYFANDLCDFDLTPDEFADKKCYNQPFGAIVFIYS